MRIISVFCLLTLLVLVLANKALPSSLSEIENIITKLDDKDYKFVSKISDKAWKVKYNLSDSEYEFFVEVWPNSGDFETDLIYIFTFLKEYREITQSDLKELSFFLKANTSSVERGFFSLFKTSGKWYLVYNITLRRSNFSSYIYQTTLLIGSLFTKVYKDIIKERKY
ncbi:MAG: hypothetical protein RMJ37_06975 [Spirochaetia bacterium]|nr:hypothetical protein [Spirochaetota bacterium]MCX8096359.1 hypothetical protein [Spirochaetota bacterium]MDW8113057.1 hypothetical protein [Spirochaetia bacterium]